MPPHVSLVMARNSAAELLDAGQTGDDLRDNRDQQDHDNHDQEEWESG